MRPSMHSPILALRVHQEGCHAATCTPKACSEEYAFILAVMDGGVKANAIEDSDEQES